MLAVSVASRRTYWFISGICLAFHGATLTKVNVRSGDSRGAEVGRIRTVLRSSDIERDMHASANRRRNID